MFVFTVLCVLLLVSLFSVSVKLYFDRFRHYVRFGNILGNMSFLQARDSTLLDKGNSRVVVVIRFIIIFLIVKTLE